jgi:hypothetical protein
MKCSKFKHSGSDTKDGTRRYKGLHRALRCEVLDSSSELEPSTNFPALRWVTTGSHELTTASAVLRYFCNKKDPQASLEQLSVLGKCPEGGICLSVQSRVLHSETICTKCFLACTESDSGSDSSVYKPAQCRMKQQTE